MKRGMEPFLVLKSALSRSWAKITGFISPMSLLGMVHLVSYWALVSLAVHVEIYRLFPSLVSHLSFSDSLYTTVKHTLRFTF